MREAPAADPVALYARMCRIRAVEESLGRLWRRGLISGEMHLGTGEEAVVAGVLAHVEDGDALALDYRSTPPLVARGVELVSLFLEVLGDEGGLCRGHGGHMHLFSREHLAASSGIVGAPAPLACGLGFAAQQAGDARVAIAFFGDGAVNQGAVMESLNLAAVWRLPVLFVCKDNRWLVTTRSSAVTAGDCTRAPGDSDPALSLSPQARPGRAVPPALPGSGRSRSPRRRRRPTRRSRPGASACGQVRAETSRITR